MSTPDGYRKYMEISGIGRDALPTAIREIPCRQSFVALYSCLISDLLGSHSAGF